MEKFNTEELYIVKPSVVVYDGTSLLKENFKKNEAEYIHTVRFEQRSTDAGIAFKDLLTLKNIFNNNEIADIGGIPLHCLEGDLYVNVEENDKILLAKYLYEKQIQTTKWNKELEDYIISLKPYYTKEELMEILKVFQESLNEETKSIEHQKKYSKKIKLGFHVM